MVKIKTAAFMLALVLPVLANASDDDFTPIPLNEVLQERTGRILTDVVTMDHIPLYVQIEEERAALEAVEKHLATASRQQDERVAALDREAETGRADDNLREEAAPFAAIPVELAGIPKVPASTDSDIDRPIELAEPVNVFPTLVVADESDDLESMQTESRDVDAQAMPLDEFDENPSTMNVLVEMLREKYMGHALQALAGIFAVLISLGFMRRRNGAKG